MERTETDERMGRRMPTRAAIGRALTTGMWLAIALGASSAVLTGGLAMRPSPAWLVLLVLAVFFATCVAKLALAALSGSSALPRFLLAAGLLMWAAGSASLQAGGDLSTTSFPAPGEGFFLASYVFFATALLIDVSRENQPATVWLEALVVCAGAVSFCAFLLLTPLAAALGADGPGLLLALLYPLIDVILGVVVLAQVLVRRRGLTRSTALLGAGWVMLAVADSTFVLNLDSMTYTANIVVETLYGIGFALIVMGFCRPPVTGAAVLRSRTRVGALIAAAGLALLVLVLRPAGPQEWYLAAPAVLTLLAAGARLVLALREAQGAAEARRLSLTDELTGLPNRRAVMRELERRLKARQPVALMLLDLDGFKEINDSLGHAAGDHVLESVAGRLSQWATGHAVVARLGGDEFAVVCPTGDEAALLQHATLLRRALREPMVVADLQVEVRASIGIALEEPGAATNASDLLRMADVAMYEAKDTRVGALTYDRARDGFSRDRLLGIADLRRGIAAGELELWYQPQVDARTRRVVALEALVRWRHPQRGLLSPLVFLPDARRSGLMTQLSEVVVNGVVADAERWHHAGHRLVVAFNCAPPELLGGRVLPLLFSALQSSPLPQGALLVEVTEDSFVTDPERAREMLSHLQRHHVQASIDDYGTGFSSLAYLRDLPVQELKIDRSFTATVMTDPRSRVIVESTRQMAHAIGLRVVAEGVEDAATAAELTDLGIDVLQGYHISRPLPADDVDTWLRRWEAVVEAGSVVSLHGSSG